MNRSYFNILRRKFRLLRDHSDQVPLFTGITHRQRSYFTNKEVCTKMTYQALKQSCVFMQEGKWDMFLGNKWKNQRPLLRREGKVGWGTTEPSLSPAPVFLTSSLGTVGDSPRSLQGSMWFILGREGICHTLVIKFMKPKKKKKIHQSCELISTCLCTAFWSYPALGTINITCQELGTHRARIYLIPTCLRARSSASITPAKIVESILFQGNWKLKF